MGAITVLLIDNNPGFLRILTSFLERYGRGHVIVAGTALGGKDGLTKAYRLRPQVVLVDLGMSDLHGLEAIPQLRSMLPDAGIIALTLLDSGSYRDAALAAGADDFVSKVGLDTDLLPAIFRLGEAGRRRGDANGGRSSGEPGGDSVEAGAAMYSGQGFSGSGGIT
jgi:DNA-binding NarL/FixJ family response regulator